MTPAEEQALLDRVKSLEETFKHYGYTLATPEQVKIWKDREDRYQAQLAQEAKDGLIIIPPA